MDHPTSIMDIIEIIHEIRRNNSWVLIVYNAIKEDMGGVDPRTKDLPLMQSVLPVLAIIAVYISFCVIWGPKLMEKRQPFELKNTLLVYNAASVVVSAWMVYEALASGWWNDYSFRCQPIDFTDNPKANRMARLVYIYFICKLVELLDTVFFVLRKKNKQVTFLHMLHHSLMPFYSFMAVRTAPGGSATLGILLNCFVHSVMYSYYLLAGLGPQYQKYLWWKSHLTKMQLIQFGILMVQQLLVFFTDCNFPKIISALYILNLAGITLLFLFFYLTSYTRIVDKVLGIVEKNLSKIVTKTE